MSRNKYRQYLEKKYGVYYTSLIDYFQKQEMQEKKVKGLGRLQVSILKIIPDDGHISMSAIRAKMYPSDWQSDYARKAVGRAIKALIRRGCVIKLGSQADPSKQHGRRVLLKAVPRASHRPKG